MPADGSLALQMNGEGLAEVVLAQLPDLLTQSADAHFEFVNDAPVIIPGTPGTSLDPAALATSVAAATAAPDRTATVELVQADPSESTAELEALGVKEIVSEFSTPLNSEPRRTVNITNGASKISGTLIRPGETFSLTEALGPIDAAHGYVEAGAIVSGEHTDAWGGGLSQVSTTTYNAAFLAGFEDVEHRPHSEWFSRYPEGREATIFTGHARHAVEEQHAVRGAGAGVGLRRPRVRAGVGHEVLDGRVDHEPALRRRRADDGVLAVADVRGAVGRQPGLLRHGDAQDVPERRAGEDRVELLALQAAEQDHLRGAAGGDAAATP